MPVDFLIILFFFLFYFWCGGGILPSKLFMIKAFYLSHNAFTVKAKKRISSVFEIIIDNNNNLLNHIII